MVLIWSVLRSLLEVTVSLLGLADLTSAARLWAGWMNLSYLSYTRPKMTVLYWNSLRWRNRIWSVRLTSWWPEPYFPIRPFHSQPSSKAFSTLISTASYSSTAPISAPTETLEFGLWCVCQFMFLFISRVCLFVCSANLMLVLKVRWEARLVSNGFIDGMKWSVGTPNSYIVLHQSKSHPSQILTRGQEWYQRLKHAQWQSTTVNTLCSFFFHWYASTGEKKKKKKVFS